MRVKLGFKEGADVGSHSDRLQLEKGVAGVAKGVDAPFVVNEDPVCSKKQWVLPVGAGFCGEQCFAKREGDFVFRRMCQIVGCVAGNVKILHPGCFDGFVICKELALFLSGL